MKQPFNTRRVDIIDQNIAKNYPVKQMAICSENIFENHVDCLLISVQRINSQLTGNVLIINYQCNAAIGAYNAYRYI